MKRFTTESSAVYTLAEITEVWIKEGGESLRDAATAYRATLVREGTTPLIHAGTHNPMDTEPAGESITFSKLPEIGYSFIYWHPTLHGCGSTPVVSIEEL